MENKSTEEIIRSAKRTVAIKYGVGSTLVMGHREKYWNEAMGISMKEYAEQVAIQVRAECAKKGSIMNLQSIFEVDIKQFLK